MLSLSYRNDTIYIAGDYTPAFLMDFEVSLLSMLDDVGVVDNLDLTKLIGSDSGLIAVLLKFQRIANEKAWNTCFINANKGIKGLITLSQLDDFFYIK